MVEKFHIVGGEQNNRSERVGQSTAKHSLTLKSINFLFTRYTFSCVYINREYKVQIRVSSGRGTAF